MTNDALDPAALERASFELVRRGFDPVPVQLELQRAAAEIRALRRQRDELQARLVERNDQADDKLEAHRVAEALGVEATQVLEAAHDAASERAERAEREAEAVRTEALASADSTRSDATKQRDEILAGARRDAEAVAKEGRQRGRDMVNEAQGVRERLLGDLARKRQTGRAQVEQLRAGRDRLLDSLAVVQQSLDTALRDLVESVPEARGAAERAGLRIAEEVEPTVAELEAEIEAARLVGHPLVDDLPDPGGGDEVFVTGEMEALTHVDAALAEPEEKEANDSVPYDVEAEEAAAAAPDDSGEDFDSAIPPDDSGEDPDSAILANGGEEDESDVVEVDLGAGLFEPAMEDSGEPSGPDLFDVEAKDAGSEGPPDGDADDAGDSIFAKLREGAAAAPADDGEDEDAAVPPDGPEDEAAAVPPDGQEDEGAAVPPDGGEDTDSLAGARVEAAEAASKALKKVLVEEQGTLLDGIRRNGTAAVAEVIEDAEAHAAPYEEAARPALQDLVATAGASLAVDLSAALAEIRSAALDPVRQRLAEAVESAGSDDDLTPVVRALYRESRSRRVPEAAAAAAVATLALARIEQAEGELRWIVDPDGPCGAGCAENAGAGSTSPGDPFPSGDRHPPATVTCTCRLEPADS